MPMPSPPPAPPTFRPNPTALPSRRPCAPAAAASTSTRAGGTSRRPRFLAGGCRGCLFVSAASVAPCAGGCGGRSPAWAGAGSRGRLCGVGKEPKQGASRGRSGLGMRRATHARTGGVQRAATCRRAAQAPSTRVKGAHGRTDRKPGQAVQDQGNQAAVKNMHETTSRRLEQTETGGPMVIQRPKSIARGMRSYPYFDGQGIIIIFKKKRWAGNNV